MTGIGKREQYGLLKEKDGTIVIDSERKIRRWKEYIRELFAYNRAEVNMRTVHEEVNAIEITKEEVKYAIKNMKNGNAIDPVELPVNIVKLIEHENL
ncbi:hypothetical protein ILUMI_14837 [Ignelater luminosus]|uniref:Uncharacterized protein n=1 Tax=Ignelater luminosus TaxID=2038154 RepID=A0A8K0CPT4_IGNLU|nr:hypothetical protein ILUMI_14837 [Ignelater luminosus]